jgi:hypothetical protein
MTRRRLGSAHGAQVACFGLDGAPSARGVGFLGRHVDAARRGACQEQQLPARQQRVQQKDHLVIPQQELRKTKNKKKNTKNKKTIPKA